MKKISIKQILATLILISATQALAVPSIKDNMKAISALYKTLSAATDVTKFADYADDAQQIADLFSVVITEVPDSINKLSDDKKPAALADFKRLIQLEIDDATALKQAYLAGDTAAIKAQLQAMGVTKVEGHDKYKN